MLSVNPNDPYNSKETKKIERFFSNKFKLHKKTIHLPDLQDTKIHGSSIQNEFGETFHARAGSLTGLPPHNSNGSKSFYTTLHKQFNLQYGKKGFYAQERLKARELGINPNSTLTSDGRKLGVKGSLGSIRRNKGEIPVPNPVIFRSTMHLENAG